MKLTRLTLSLFVLLCLSAGCKKEEVPPKTIVINKDLRATSVGFYTYVMKIYEVENGVLVYTGETNDDEGELFVYQSDTDPDRIRIMLEDVIFDGDGIRPLGQGFVFDVPLTDIPDEDISFIGENHFDVEGGKYHGYCANGKFNVAIRIDEGGGLESVYAFSCTKY